jgi:hypothetical protein
MSTTTFMAELLAKQASDLNDMYGTTDQWEHAPPNDGRNLRKFENSVAKEHQFVKHPAKAASHMNLVKFMEQSGSVTPMRIATPEIQELRAEVQQPRIPTQGKLKGTAAEPPDSTTTYVVLGLLAAMFVVGATVFSV